MNKTYAFTDLHGIYDLWAQIKDYCNETDTLYFLGDAADRGPDGLKIIKELLTDKRIKYLLGNHEEMMLDTIQCYLPNFDGSLDPMDTEEWIWMQNGGYLTLEDFKQESDIMKITIFKELKNSKETPKTEI